MDSERLVVQTEAALVRAPGSVQVSLQINEFRLFGIDDLGQTTDFNLGFPLVLFKVRLHFEGLSLRSEKLVVCLAEYFLHLVDVLPHCLVFILDIG